MHASLSRAPGMKAGRADVMAIFVFLVLEHIYELVQFRPLPTNKAKQEVLYIEPNAVRIHNCPV